MVRPLQWEVVMVEFEDVCLRLSSGQMVICALLALATLDVLHRRQALGESGILQAGGKQPDERAEMALLAAPPNIYLPARRSASGPRSLHRSRPSA